jgi:hypothetical protein
VSAVAECPLEADSCRTGDAVRSAQMIDAIGVTGGRTPGVWSVYLDPWLELISGNSLSEYTQRRNFLGQEILPQTEMATGEAFLEMTSLPVHSSVGFYTNVAAFLNLHEELLPRVRSVTLEQSRRLTEVLFHNKLVRRLR